MKALVSYLAVAAMIVASSFTVSQQKQLNQAAPSSCFGRFNVHRAGKANTQLTWTVTENNITRFQIERSYDGEFFDPIDAVDFNGSSTYKRKDAFEYPGYIFYRITAFKSDGSTECSPVESVRIVKHG